MSTDDRIKPNTGHSGRGNPGPEVKTTRIRQDARASKALGVKWHIIFSIVLLVLCMILPWILFLGLRIDFRATTESIDQWEEGREGVLTGTATESYTTTVSTEYEASFVPVQLTEKGIPFTFMTVLYGPLMLTGSPLEMDAISTSGNEDFSGFARISFRSFWAPVLFVLLFLVVLFLTELFSKNPNAVLWFVVTMAIVWFVYGFITWAFGGLATGSVDDILNQLLTEEQGSAKFGLGYLNVIHAPIRVFLWGTIYWVVSFLFRRARSEPPGRDAIHPRPMKP